MRGRVLIEFVSKALRSENILYTCILRFNATKGGKIEVEETLVIY